jgi:hypothetical protein
MARLLSKNEYPALLYSLMYSTSMALVPTIALPNATLTLLSLLVLEVSKVK